MIDQNDLLLYRRLNDGREQTIPINQNKAMHKFMCVDGAELSELIEDSVGGNE